MYNMYVVTIKRIQKNTTRPTKIRNRPRVSANGGKIGDRNKSEDQYLFVLKNLWNSWFFVILRIRDSEWGVYVMKI
jgi:hypothetical protein